MGLANGNPRTSATARGGHSLKQISLLTLVVQNSTLILLLQYSRTMPLVGGQRYFSSTAIFLNELIKFAICLSIALYDISRSISPSSPATALFTNLFSAVFTGDSWKVAIPACLYVLQNSLQYLAISNLDGATYQVTYQFKILPTAIFSVLLLNRRLSLRKWVALALLMVGVAIVQTPASEPISLTSLKSAQSALFKRSWFSAGDTGASALHKRSATYEGIVEDDMLEHPTMNAPLGFAAAISGCIVSSAASVYFEKVLKVSDSHVSLWVRNVQLAFYSLFPALFIGVIFVDGEKIAQNGFFTGYNWIVWTVVVLQALGGIIISMCVAYADNIAKGFAIGISILVSLLASIYVFDFEASPKFLIGTAIVLFATYLYNSQGFITRPPPIKIHSYEKTTIDGQDPGEKDPSLHLPFTPFKHDALTTSRPSSPSLHHHRVGSARGYFGSKDRED